MTLSTVSGHWRKPVSRRDQASIPPWPLHHGSVNATHKGWYHISNLTLLLSNTSVFCFKAGLTIESKYCTYIVSILKTWHWPNFDVDWIVGLPFFRQTRNNILSFNICLKFRLEINRKNRKILFLLQFYNIIWNRTIKRFSVRVLSFATLVASVTFYFKILKSKELCRAGIFKNCRSPTLLLEF